MDELIARLTSAAGIGEEAAKKAVGLILGFIEKEAPNLHVGELVARIPGIDALVRGESATSGAGGGLMGMLGGLLGGTGGDLMTLADRLRNEAGLDLAKIETVGKEIFAFLRSKLGDEAVDKIVAAVPGLSRFV